MSVQKCWDDGLTNGACSLSRPHTLDGGSGGLLDLPPIPGFKQEKSCVVRSQPQKAKYREIRNNGFVGSARATSAQALRRGSIQELAQSLNSISTASLDGRVVQLASNRRKKYIADLQRKLQ